MAAVPQCLMYLETIREYVLSGRVLWNTALIAGMIAVVLSLIAKRIRYESEYVPKNVTIALVSALVGSSVAQRIANSARVDCEPGQSALLNFLGYFASPLLIGVALAFFGALILQFLVLAVTEKLPERTQDAVAVGAATVVGLIAGAFV